MIVKTGNIIDQIPFLDYRDLILIPSGIETIDLQSCDNNKRLTQIFPEMEDILKMTSDTYNFGTYRIYLEHPSISCYPCFSYGHKGDKVINWGALGRHLDINIRDLSERYRTINFDFPPIYEMRVYSKEQSFYGILEFLAGKLNRNNIFVWLGENGNKY